MEEEKYEYDPRNRMLYHPDFHFNQGKKFTGEELEYLCKFYEYDLIRNMAFALGRTEVTIIKKVQSLKKQGLFWYYKNRNRYY
ncbi:DNA-entry nuclease [Gottfriedia acidiceleris]|uniref:DNA-entry nuclease n=1 Tax=Gottfriedia acidiceleris TaxID=371036 RepID=UPI003AF319DD